MRELLYGAKRFTDLLEGLPGIGTNTLTTRLAELEDSGILTRKRMPAPLAVTVIELSDRGRALEPVLVSLARWGTAPLMASKPRHGLRPAWVGLALRTYFDAAAARGKRVRVALCLSKGTLGLEFGHGPLHIAEGEPAQPADLRVTVSEQLLIDILRGAVSLTAARRKRELSVEGDAELLPRLLAAFPVGSPALAHAAEPVQ